MNFDLSEKVTRSACKKQPEDMNIDDLARILITSDGKGCDFKSDTLNEFSKRCQTYYELKIIAKDEETEIWVADSENNFVQKEKGMMHTSLLGGFYNVVIGKLGGEKKELKLFENIEITEDEL